MTNVVRESEKSLGERCAFQEQPSDLHPLTGPSTVEALRC